MIRINLLPVRAAQKKEKLRGQVIVLIGFLVITVLICAGAYGSMQVRISGVNDEIRQNQAEIDRLKKTIGEVAHFKKLQEELRGKLDVLDQLKAGKIGPVHLLDELSMAVPDRLWIDSFKESGGKISINGVGLTEEVVADFMRRLDSSPYFQKVELQVIEQAGQGGRKLQKFSLNCNVESPAAKPKNP
jgi:type IV pilus assembly protein PilN